MILVLSLISTPIETVENKELKKRESSSKFKNLTIRIPKNNIPAEAFRIQGPLNQPDDLDWSICRVILITLAIATGVTVYQQLFPVVTRPIPKNSQR